MRKTIPIVLIIAVAAGLIWHFSKSRDPEKTAEEYNAKGYGLYLEGETKEAKQLFKKAIKLAPRDPNYYYNLGLCYCVEHNYGRAKDYFKKTLEIRPNASPAIIYYAYCIVKTAKNQAVAIEKACREIGKIPERHFDVRPIAYVAARIYAITNRPDLALRYLTHSIKTHPELREAAAADPDFESIRHLPEFKQLVY